MAEIGGNGARFGVNAEPHLELSPSRMIFTELNDSLNSRPRFDVDATDTYYSDPFDIPSSAISTGLTVKIAGGFVKVTPAALSIGDSSRIDESDATFLAGTSMIRVGKAASDRVTVDPTNGITIYKGNNKRLQTTANGIDVYGSNGTTNIASFGSTVTLGNAASGNVLTLDTSGMKVSSSSANDLMNLGLGLRAQEVRQFSDSTISSVPHVLTLDYTPRDGSIVVYQGVDISYNAPEGESTYQYTVSGKTLTITDSRLVGYKYLVIYTATDFEAVSLAVGSYVKADGARTIASGTGSKALGQNSFASGYYAEASGKTSHAEGE